jgi:hypothetical protein
LKICRAFWAAAEVEKISRNAAEINRNLNLVIKKFLPGRFSSIAKKAKNENCPQMSAGKHKIKLIQPCSSAFICGQFFFIYFAAGATIYFFTTGRTIADACPPPR